MAFEYTTTAFKTYPSAATSVSISPSTTAWANSAWVQLTASTSNAITLSAIIVDTGVAAQFEVEIGKGAAGSETVVCTLAGHVESVSSGMPCVLYVPIEVSNIASGTRVAVRLRKGGTNATAWGVALQYLDSGTPTGITTTAVPCKVTPTAANGISITPSATAWASSAWAQITASTSTAIILGAVTIVPSAAQPFEIDIGTGGAGSEVVVATVRGNIDSQTGMPWQFLLEPPLDNIGSGVRVSARMRKPGVSTTAWTIKLNYYEKPI